MHGNEKVCGYTIIIALSVALISSSIVVWLSNFADMKGAAKVYGLMSPLYLVTTLFLFLIVRRHMQGPLWKAVVVGLLMGYVASVISFTLGSLYLYTGVADEAIHHPLRYLVTKFSYAIYLGGWAYGILVSVLFYLTLKLEKAILSHRNCEQKKST